MVRIEFFSKDVLCDRYNLLRYDANYDISDIIYTETGNAFNGFDRPFIVNTNYDIIKDSRLCTVTIPNFNSGNRIFCLINDIKPLRDNKCLVYVEIDAWLYYRNLFNVGNDNYLFQCTEELGYSYRDLSADYKVITKTRSINTCEYWNIIMMYHDSTNNQDRIYLFKSTKTDYFPFYSIDILNLFNTLNIDTNSIMSIYLSPFDVDATYWVLQSDTATLKSYYLMYNEFIKRQYYSNDANKFKESISIVSDYKTKTVITDMSGAIVWQSQRKDSGTRYLNCKLDVTYDSCSWIVGITDMSTREYQDSPNLRFVINCVNLAYYLDYYQQYANLEKSFNIELRKAQLDKQLIDGLGNSISSSVNMGTMSAVGGSVGAGAVAGAVGGLASTGLSYFATADYNKKVENIENRQAQVQYDTITSSNDSFLAFLTGEIEPSIYTMSIDNESLKSQTNANDEPYLTYNCRIRNTDVINLIRVKQPSYISGDFQFIKMNEKDAIQLNTRFKHGVNFVSWK